MAAENWFGSGFFPPRKFRLVPGITPPFPIRLNLPGSGAPLSTLEYNIPKTSNSFFNTDCKVYSWSAFTSSGFPFVFSWASLIEKSCPSNRVSRDLTLLINAGSSGARVSPAISQRRRGALSPVLNRRVRSPRSAFDVENVSIEFIPKSGVPPVCCAACLMNAL